MTIKAVLFDLDDTLFDHQGSSAQGLEAFLGALGRVPGGSLRQAWFEVERTNYERWLAGEISFPEQRRERLRAFLPTAGVDVPASGEHLDDLFAVYLSHYEAAWTAFDDAVDALSRLAAQGLVVAVMTNGNHEQQTQKIHRIGLAGLVGSVFSSERIGYAKPLAEAFLLPCESLQLAPQEVLYVGDNFRTDIEGARSAGLPAIHLDRAGVGQDASAVRSLVELPALLKRGLV